jgi:hypothetical protein
MRVLRILTLATDSRHRTVSEKLARCDPSALSGVEHLSLLLSKSPSLAGQSQGTSSPLGPPRNGDVGERDQPRRNLGTVWNTAQQFSGANDPK